MCRFIAFLGNPVVLHDILFKPKNSLIQQSIHAREMTEPLNGDGFGISWYVHEIDNFPAMFKSIQPAWSDSNLEHLSKKIRTDCFFAHVRAASSGGVNVLNTHPFDFKNLVFMHNGDIGGFQKIKRQLRRELPDPIYNWIRGQTDSEHFFAAFLNHFSQTGEHFTAKNAAKALRETIIYINELAKLNNVTDASYINAVISDGRVLLAIRYVSDVKENAPTLYYAMGKRFEYFDGACHMHPTNNDESNGAFLVVSEKLNAQKAEWHEIPTNHVLLVYNDLTYELEPIS